MGAGSYNVFYGNIVRNTGVGIDHDGYGLALGGNHLVADNNLFFRNIFANNTKNFATNWPVTGGNSFDNGKEGNYWDDYKTKYPNASEVDNSGTGNLAYALTLNNVDNHPLLTLPDVSDGVLGLPEPWASLLPNSVFLNLSQLQSSSPSPLPTTTSTSLPSQSVLPTPTKPPETPDSSDPLTSSTLSPLTPPSQQPPPSPSVPEFPTWIILPLLPVVALLVYFSKRRRVKQ
jgi:hypothetical protein